MWYPHATAGNMIKPHPKTALEEKAEASRRRLPGSIGSRNNKATYRTYRKEDKRK
jgi:hypothetical protein